jgi:hypothetical protein
VCVQRHRAAGSRHFVEIEILLSWQLSNEPREFFKNENAQFPWENRQQQERTLGFFPSTPASGNLATGRNLPGRDSN